MDGLPVHEETWMDLKNILPSKSSQRWETPCYVCVCLCVCVRMHALSRAWLFATPWSAAHQAPLSVEFSRQEHGNWFHFLLHGIFLTQGSNPCLLPLLNWRVDCSLLCRLGSPTSYIASLTLTFWENPSCRDRGQTFGSVRLNGSGDWLWMSTKQSRVIPSIYIGLWWWLHSCINVFKLTCVFKMSEFPGTTLTHCCC